MGTRLARRGLITAIVVTVLSVVGGNVAARAAVTRAGSETPVSNATSATVSNGAAVASIEWGLDPVNATRVATVEIDLTGGIPRSEVHVIVNSDGRAWPCT